MRHIFASSFHKEFWPICQAIVSQSDSQSNEIWNYLSPATAFWMWVWYPFKWGSNAVQNGNEILTRLKMVGLLSTPGANYLDLLLRQIQPWLSIGLVCNQQQLKSFKSSEAPIQEMILARPKKLSFQARFLCLPLITRCWLFHFLFFPSLNNFIIVDQICITFDILVKNTNEFSFINIACKKCPTNVSQFEHFSSNRTQKL